jgi:hypothetical protein
MSPQS